MGLYDYGARWYDPAIARWTSVDPLASSMASWSPYNYVFNNPLKYTDPTGMAPFTDFYNNNGKYIGTDGKDDGQVVVVTDNSEARQIKKTDKAGGTTDASSVSSGVLLPSAFVRTEMAKAVDRAGSPSFHEEGGVFGTNSDGTEFVAHAVPGEEADPSVDPEASVNVFQAANPDDLKDMKTIDGAFHTHPDGAKSSSSSGTSGGVTTIGGATTTHHFNNPPSGGNGKRGDITNAARNTMGVTGSSYVLAQGNKTVYKYNGSGVQGQVSFKAFFSAGIKKR